MLYFMEMFSHAFISVTIFQLCLVAHHTANHISNSDIYQNQFLLLYLLDDTFEIKMCNYFSSHCFKSYPATRVNCLYVVTDVFVEKMCVCS